MKAEPPESSLLVQCLQLSKSFRSGRHVFQDANFQAGKGEFIFLLGDSRSGKSTFFRLLLGIELPDQGNILIDGKSIHQLSGRELLSFRRCTGVVFQDLKLLQDRSVFENVALPLEILERGDSYILRKVYRTLRAVGLEAKEDVSCGELSGSEQQLAAIARALVHDPALLLVDEPTASLDEDDLSRAMKLFQDANARGATVIVASHDSRLESMAPSSRTLAIHQGRLVDRSLPSGLSVAI